MQRRPLSPVGATHAAMMVARLASAGTLAIACGGASSGVAPPEASRARAEASATAASPPAGSSAGTGAVSGEVAGHPMAVRSAVFMWREKANDMQIVLADKPGLCESLRDGGWPIDATVLYLTLKHNARDNRDAPFRAGDYPLRSGAALPQDAKQAVFMKLDEMCTPVATGKATAGVVHLSTKEVALGGTVEGSFELTIGAADTLEGRFTASFCQSDQEPEGCPAMARTPIE